MARTKLGDLPIKKLTLNRETIRTLNADELESVEGASTPVATLWTLATVISYEVSDEVAKSVSDVVKKSVHTSDDAGTGWVCTFNCDSSFTFDGDNKGAIAQR